MEYNNKDIKTLTQTQHMRRRPVRYVGHLGDGSDSEDGLYVM